jgi:hypothetical protein
MPPPVRPRPSSSQLARNDPAELQSPAADRLRKKEPGQEGPAGL